MNNHITMQCKAYECSEEATPGFKGCTIQHGYEIKTIPQQIKKWQDGANWRSTVLDIKHEPVGAIEHYSLMV